MKAQNTAVQAIIKDVAFKQPRHPTLAVESFWLHDLHQRQLDHDLTLPTRITFHFFLLVTKGAGKHTVDFVDYACAPGDIIKVSPGQVHIFDGRDRIDGIVVIFKERFLFPQAIKHNDVASADAPLNVEDWPVKLTPAREERGNLESLFSAVNQQYNAYDSSQRGERVIGHLLHALLFALAGSAKNEGPAWPAQDHPHLMVVRQLRLALEEKLAKTRAVADYARTLGCSQKTLSRACLQILGKTPKSVIDERVALEAKRLIAHTAWPAARVSEQLGFTEATNFVKFFRRQVGVTPEQFRQKIRPT
ncbi:MAG: AraC family transcriptional regulator [Deltaproteobacteria bacterium]|nr:AraC family transcriptional regulator [Deltaproteobacteria bacterium]